VAAQKHLLLLDFVDQGLLMNLEMNLGLFKELGQCLVTETLEIFVGQDLQRWAEAEGAVQLVALRD